MKATKQQVLGLIAITAAGALAGCSTVSGWTSGWTHREEPRTSTSAMSGFIQSVMLTGANEVPPVQTSASGAGIVTVNADHTVAAKITVTGVAATAAHIHMGAAGANGPVIVPFTKTADNVFEAPPGSTMTEEQYAAFKAGNTYVNVHSDANKGGEIRAQLKGG